MNSIDTFLPKFRELNNITANVINNNRISEEEQKKITEFYHEYSDIKVFEKIILEIIQKQESEIRFLLLSGIKSVILQHEELYNSSSEKLQQINIMEIYDRRNNWLHEIIDRQSKITTKSSNELYQVNKSLDAIGHREHTSEEVAQLWREHEQLTKEYKEEKDKLSTLYKQQKEMRNEFSKYDKNLFSKIYALSISFLLVLNSYDMTKEQIQEKKEEKEPEGIEKLQIQEDGLYLDMKYVAIAFDECNDKQFEKLSETTLYALLNLQPINVRVVTKKGEKMRMGYLIRKLHENLKQDLDRHEKKQWLITILKSFGIKETLYEKKCTETELKEVSSESERFVESMNELFN